MPRLAKIGIFLLVGIVAVIVLLPIFSPRRAPVLYVHVDGLAWTNVTVQSANLSQPQRFDQAMEVRVSPVSHGVYRICVYLVDGQSVWSEFFHSDARNRWRVDVFLAPSTNPGCIHFRETANQKELLFESDARPSDSTEQNPFRLDWI